MSFGSDGSRAALPRRNMQSTLCFTRLSFSLVVHCSLHAGRKGAQDLTSVKFRARTLFIVVFASEGTAICGCSWQDEPTLSDKVMIVPQVWKCVIASTGGQ